MPRYTSKDFDEMMGVSDFDEFKENIKNSDEDRMLHSKSPTAGIQTQKQLMEMREVNLLLTEFEANEILKVYLSALERIFKENEIT